MRLVSFNFTTLDTLALSPVPPDFHHAHDLHQACDPGGQPRVQASMRGRSHLFQYLN